MSVFFALGEIETSQTEGFRQRLIVEGTTLQGDISGRVIAAKTIRRYDAATALELTLWDGDMLLLTSGLLTRSGKARKADFDQAAWARFGAMRLTLDGIAYRLAGTAGVYDSDGGTITLTFEDEVAALMRRHKRVFALQRGPSSSIDGWSRGQFLLKLAWQIKETRISVFSPEDSIEQPVKGDTSKAKTKARKKGFAKGKKLTIDARDIDDEQRRQLTTALTRADQDNAGERATLAMLVAGMGESSFRAVANFQGSGYAGVFQALPANIPQADTDQQAHYFLIGGKGFQSGGAIKAAADNPDWSAGTIAYKVEGSRANFNSDAAAEGHYGQYQKEAEVILDAWGGSGEIRLVRHKYKFRTKKNENYWAAANRIGTEVKGWRLFADQNQLVYVSDLWLFQRQPTILLRPRDPAVRSTSFDADIGVPVGEMTVNAGVADWVGPPGSVVEVDDAGPFNGRWLLASHERDELTEESVLLCRRPSPKGKEPAPETEKVTQTETTPETGSVRGNIITACERAYKRRGKYHYRQTRPYPDSLFSAGDKYIDCSSFATLVYKSAGANDPNGRNYDGQGYTGTLWANGTKTNDPQPGDLCFFGQPASTNAHVNVYAGDGKAYNMGPSAGLSFVDKDVRPDFIGFRSYDLEG